MSKTFFKVRGGRLVETDSSSREVFLGVVKRALGRLPTFKQSTVPDRPVFSRNQLNVKDGVESTPREVLENSVALMATLEKSASDIGWKVVRARSNEDVLNYILELATELAVSRIECSGHHVLEEIALVEKIKQAGIEVGRLTYNGSRQSLENSASSIRKRAIVADIGITGVDYAIAETGSCVLFADEKLSRLGSLLPPVHVAVVKSGQVLPGLDELFDICRRDFITQGRLDYMSIISGPSRSGDIEQKLTVGVHGPKEAHMVLLESDD